MADLASRIYAVEIERVHGARGIENMRDVLRVVKHIYTLHSPQSFTLGLVVFSALDDGAKLLDGDPPATADSYDGLGDTTGMVEILANGRFRSWPIDFGLLDKLSESAVVYAYSEDLFDESEVMIVKGRALGVPNPNGYPSAFAPPTFWELDQALAYYRTDMAARSTCKILKNVWAPESEDRRLILQNYPEEPLRESLAQHLRSTLRDHLRVLVKEEQNVSETEPVDIEVSWSLTTQLALIEVKWLGKCLNKAGDGLASYSYGNARADSGYNQLWDYLDDAYERRPGHEIQGYLVVFDARRYGVTAWEPDPISAENAWKYEKTDLEVGKDRAARSDMHDPVRFYLEPKIPRPVA